MMTNLSDRQREVVEADLNGSLLVLASAGSGKTRVLTERVKYVLTRTKKEGVIALTFTNKAAEEMKERLKSDGIDENRLWLGTVHSVAQRILESHGHTLNLPANVQIYERDKDRMEVFLKALRTDGVDIDEYLNVDDPKEKRSRERNLQDYMDGFSKIKREMLSEEDAKAHFSENADIWRVYSDYQDALLNSGGIDYEDILRYAHRILLTQEWIANIYRAKYSYIFVDEAQDLNRLQYEFIKTLAGTNQSNVMMVGDPDQMIYGFNGSSASYMSERFVNDFQPITFKLSKNYRSSRAVIHAANSLRSGSQNESEFALEGVAQVLGFESEEDEAAWVIASIKNLVATKTNPEIEGEITYSNMVVIARNRFVFMELEKGLAAQSIPYNLKFGERGKLPTSEFGKILDSALRVKLNPKDWVDGRKLCTLLKINPPIEWGKLEQIRFLRKTYIESAEGSTNLISDLLSAVDELDDESPNILKFEGKFDAQLAELAKAEQSEDVRLEYERSLDELREFSERWVRFRQLGLGSTLATFRNADALGKLHPDNAENGVILSTVHTMKGLEKDIVFLMGFCEGVFPDYRATSEKDIREERNAAFVAITRARRWLYITYPKVRMMPWKSTRRHLPSRFINAMGLTIQS